MFSKIFALSTLLGLLAALPANAAEIEVVAGGPDGLIQYNPSFVVRRPYYFSSWASGQAIFTRLPTLAMSSRSSSSRRTTP